LRRVNLTTVHSETDAVVELVKRCPVHGDFSTVIWRGARPDFADWRRDKLPSQPMVCFTKSDKGCPQDCGLCDRHAQHTCTALIEVTQRCELECPVCYASSRLDKAPDPDLATIEFWYKRAWEASGRCNIQLSGGEPAMRDDLPEIITLGRKLGFDFIQLNSNGFRLGQERGFAQRLKDAGLASVFLQFDGIDDEIYRRLRGRELFRQKQRALEACDKAGLGVVLVAVVAPGVNDGALGDILRYGQGAGAFVRGVHFQPISYFGRYPGKRIPCESARLTLPDLMRALEEQSRGRVRVEDFSPPGCEHSHCSFHANYLRESGGKLRLLSGKGGNCCGPKPAVEGAAASVAFTARQWSAPPDCGCGAAPAYPPKAPPSLDDFLEQAKTWTFSVSAMGFQDAWTLDLERLRGCCIHVVAPDGRLVPFCAYNLTAEDGRALHRGVAR
jgi:uncharacterized radical SAM superfamily Fe-S cluster-containing enzyme